MSKQNYYLKKTCGIYCITHTESGKKYVGQSLNCLERWKVHTTPKKNSNGIKGAIMKYGVEAFTFSIIEECNKEDLNDREAWWISTLATLSPSGYNLTSGGGQGTTVSNETRNKQSKLRLGKKLHPHSEETKQRMRKPKSEEHKKNLSNSKKGKTLSDEHKKQLSESKKGKTGNNKGKKLGPISDEQKQKLSDAAKAHWALKKLQNNLES